MLLAEMVVLSFVPSLLLRSCTAPFMGTELSTLAALCFFLHQRLLSMTARS
jgi:hypothetical protein